jgi:Calcineurin-like phosphoesterase
VRQPTRGPWAVAVAAVVLAASVPSVTAVLAASTEVCTIAAAGDIAQAGGDQERTAQLVESLHPNAVLTLGDNAYPDGSAEDYRTHYDPSWGRFKAITRPAPGNHEYRTPGGKGYLDYFGVPAYYSYDVCGWHAYALNRELSGAEREAQLAWLKDDLARHRGQPLLAAWHEPRWTTGDKNGADEGAGDLWEAVVAGGVRVVLNGHEHSYERFAEMDAGGRPSPGGTREFIAGEGGASLSGFGPSPLAASEVRRSGTHGVLSLTLRPDGYDWRYVQVGGTVADSGSQSFAGAAVTAAALPPGDSPTPAASSPAWTARGPGMPPPLPTTAPSSPTMSSPAASPLATAPSTTASTAPSTRPAPPVAGGVSYWWLPASQGAYVKGTEPARGFGADPDLVVDAVDRARHVTFLTFDLSVVPGGATPASGRLYLHATTDIARPVDVYAAPSGWAEQTLTWQSQPAFTPRLVGRIAPARAGQWVSLDVSAALAAGGPVSFALTGSDAGRSDARFASDETGTPPTLYLGLRGVTAR